MSSKIRLAHALSWISDDLNTDLHTIRKIRNKFAHDPYKQRLDDIEIVPLVDALRPSEEPVIQIFRDEKMDIPTPTSRLRYHLRTSMVCHQVAIQMAADPLAISHRVHPAAIIGSYEDGSENRRNLARSQAMLAMELLGGEVSEITL